ncbi:MAG: Fic family protein [Thermomicrobiales bacterium]
MTDYLSVGDILALHAEVMGRLGRWPSRLLNEDGLSAEVHRPRAAEHYEGADLIRQAAILAVRIAQLRPFGDGNLPTAFAATETFLRLNGLALRTGQAMNLARLLRLLSEEHDPDEATEQFEMRLRTIVGPEHDTA